MKVKKEYIVLAMVIAALAAYLVLRSRDRSLYELPAVAPVETKQVTRMEVAKAGQVVVFEKTGGDWQIKPQNYAADPEAVKEMLAVAEALTLTELISESRNYRRYELDEAEGIVFKCWAKKDLRCELTIGKTADSYHHTFVKLPGDAAVYHARGNFREKFDKQTDDFREKTVLAFDPKAVASLEISIDGITETFKRIPSAAENAGAAADGGESTPPKNEEERWVDSEGHQAETAKVVSLVSTLSKLKCDSFIADKTKDDLVDPVYTLVLKGAQTHTLQVYAEVKNEDETLVPAVSSGNAYPFFLTKWQSENIMKKPEEFKKSNPQDE